MRRARQRQQQRQWQRRQHAGAATERQRRQQQQRQQQPVALVQPYALAAAALVGHVPGRIEHAQRLQVRAIHAQGRVTATTGRGQRTQGVAVQARGLHRAGGIAVHGAGGAAQAEHRGPVTLARHGRSDFTGGRIGLVGHQQDVATLEAGLVQQGGRLGDRALGPTPVHRHHVRRQGVQEQGDVAGVGGQWCHRVRILGPGHQAHFAALALAQQGIDLGPCLGQAGRLQVRGEHRGGQVQRDHQRRPRFPVRPRLLAPARTGQRQHRQHPGQRHPRQPQPRPAMPGLEQVRQQVRVHRITPALVPTATPQQPQQRQGQQCPQPQRPLEMQLRHLRQDLRPDTVHGLRLRNGQATSASARAPPSGQG